MNTMISNQEVMRQGLEWLKAERDEVVRLSVRALGVTRIDYYRKMTTEQRRVIAANNLDGMITRMEGSSVNTALMKASFLASLKQGVSLQVMLSGIDELMNVLNQKASADLAKQPQVCEALLQKANYYVNLVKATMAAAMIEHEASRAISVKPVR